MQRVGIFGFDWCVFFDFPRLWVCCLACIVHLLQQRQFFEAFVSWAPPKLRLIKFSWDPLFSIFILSFWRLFRSSFICLHKKTQAGSFCNKFHRRKLCQVRGRMGLSPAESDFAAGEDLRSAAVGAQRSATAVVGGIHQRIVDVPQSLGPQKRNEQKNSTKTDKNQTKKTKKTKRCQLDQLRFGKKTFGLNVQSPRKELRLRRVVLSAANRDHSGLWGLNQLKILAWRIAECYLNSCATFLVNRTLFYFCQWFDCYLPGIYCYLLCYWINLSFDSCYLSWRTCRSSIPRWTTFLGSQPW